MKIQTLFILMLVALSSCKSNKSITSKEPSSQLLEVAKADLVISPDQSQVSVKVLSTRIDEVEGSTLVELLKIARSGFGVDTYLSVGDTILLTQSSGLKKEETYQVLMEQVRSMSEQKTFRFKAVITN